MVSAKTFLVASTLATAASAHFILDYPYNRGFDEDKEPSAPCGGFPLNKTRTPFPLSGGYIVWSSYHNTAVALAGISFNSNPTSLTNFNTTSKGTNYPLLLPQVSTTVEGAFCAQVNISSLNVPDAVDGANATIAMVYNGEDGILYQCSDVTLKSDYTIPSSISCKSAGKITGGSTSGAPPSSTTPASSTSPAGSSPTGVSATTTTPGASSSPSSSSAAPPSSTSAKPSSAMFSIGEPRVGALVASLVLAASALLL